MREKMERVGGNVKERRRERGKIEKKREMKQANWFKKKEKWKRMDGRREKTERGGAGGF